MKFKPRFPLQGNKKMAKVAVPPPPLFFFSNCCVQGMLPNKRIIMHFSVTGAHLQDISSFRRAGTAGFFFLYDTITVKIF